MGVFRGLVACAAVLLLCAGCKRDGDITETDTETDTHNDEPQPAVGIHIKSISVNQAIGALVWDDGSAVQEADRTVPLIAGRDAVVRLIWELDSDYEPRDITAVLTLDSSAGTETYTQTQRIDEESDRDWLERTVNFDIPAAQMRGDTSLSAELLEVQGEPGGDAPNRVPEDGAIPLNAWDDEMRLKVKAFPCWMPCGREAWGFEGEPLGITASQKQITEDFLMNLYPIQGLDITWDDAPFEVDACSSGGALDVMQARRAREGAGPEEYYHCIFRQKYDTSFAGGFAWLLGPDAAEPRVSFSVNWWGPDDEMLTNVAHEIGHNHGRNHPWHDPNWQPSQAGDTGCRSTWGLGIRPGPIPTAYWYPNVSDPSDVIMAPCPNLQSCEYDEEHTLPVTGDVMSYTFPQWVDPYTYKAFAERVRTVSSYAAEESQDSWINKRTLFATFTEDGVRWTWGYGALGSGDALGKDFAEVSTAKGTLRVPIRPRIGSNSRVRGFSMPVPEAARVSPVHGENALWRGTVQAQFQGRIVTVDLQTLTLAPTDYGSDINP